MSSYFNSLFARDGSYKHAGSSSFTTSQLLQQGLKAYEQCANCPGAIAIREAKNNSNNNTKNNTTNNNTTNNK